MNIITDVNIPRWYGLSWDAQSAAIVLSMLYPKNWTA